MPNELTFRKTSFNLIAMHHSLLDTARMRVTMRPIEAPASFREGRPLVKPTSRKQVLMQDRNATGACPERPHVTALTTTTQITLLMKQKPSVID